MDWGCEVELTPTTDAVADFCAAASRADVDGMVAALAPDAELVSPVTAHLVFRGSADLEVLLGAVFGGLDGLRWRDVVGDGSTRVAVSEARIWGVRINDAMVFELDDAGFIRRIRPHLRPWLALTLLASRLGVRLARHPGVVRRALQRA